MEGENKGREGGRWIAWTVAIGRGRTIENERQGERPDRRNEMQDSEWEGERQRVQEDGRQDAERKEER